MKKNVLKLSLLLVSVFLISLSCKIGLGEAVDTVPPNVTIDAPVADALVRDTFIMSGSWSDDLALDKVTVSLKNLSTGTTYDYAAEKKGSKTTEGTWSLKVEPVKDGKTVIPDGTYTATITAHDTYGQTNIATQTFSVDNTCPILIISSPNTAMDIADEVINDIAGFGKIFGITGQYSDDSGVDSIEVVFYDESEQELASTSLKVKGTTIDDNVAIWGDANGLYEKLYGNDQQAGTKPFYCSIRIYDAARKVPAVSGDKGNCCEYIYLSSDIQEIFADSDDSFKAKQAYAVLNGSTPIGTMDSFYKEWYKQRETLKKSRLTFSLNPINNPSFTVSNYSSFVPGKPGTEKELDTISASDGVAVYEFKDKSQLSVTVSPGLDKNDLVKNTLGITLVECNVAGIPFTNPDGSNKNEVKLNLDAEDGIKNLNGSYVLKATIHADNYDGIDIGKYYIIRIDGEDTKHNIITNGGNVYAIKYAPVNTTAPTINFTKINGNAATASIAIADENIVIEGSTTYFPDAIRLEVYIGNPDEDGNKPVITSPGIPVDGPGATENGFEISNPVQVDQKKTVDFKVTLSAKDIEDKIIENEVVPADKTIEVHLAVVLCNAGVEGDKSIQVTVDRQSPIFDSEFTVSPTVEVGSESYVNGKVTVEASVSDNITMNPAVEYTLDGATWRSLGNTRKIKIENIDTTAFADKTTHKIKFRARDGVGNINTFEIPLNVDQSTDTPKITPTNFEETLTADTAIAPAAGDEHNLFGITSNNKLTASISDDDGISLVRVLTQPGKEWKSAVTPTEKKYTVSGTTTYSLNHTLSQTAGYYVIKIEVTDSKAETAKNKYEIGPFLVAVDRGAPTIEVTSQSGQNKKAATKYPVEGTVSDDTAVIVEAYSDEACTTKLGDASVANGRFTYELTTDGAEAKTVYFKATDIYKRSSTAKYSYVLDLNPPVFDSVYTVSPTVTLGDTEYVNGKVSVEIGLSDNITLKPKVEYSLNGTTWIDLGKTTKATIPVIDTTAFTDNAAKVIKFRATDDVGNVGTTDITINVKQSTDTPAIAPTNFEETLTLESAIAPAAGDEHNLYGITSDNFLSATLTDDDGVGEVIVSWQKAVTWNAATTPVTKSYNGNGAKSYTLKHTLPADAGKYVVKISVTDSKAETAKNSYEIGPFLVAVDGGVPVVSVTTSSGQYKKASTAYTIEGTVSDDTAVTVAAYSNSDCTTKLGDATVTNGTFSYELTTDAAVGKTVYFKATDIYKRSSVAQFSYLIDKDAPEFDTVYTVSPTVTLGDTEYVNGKVSLEIGLSDNISLKSKVEYSLDDGTTWTSLGKTTKATIPVINTTAFTDNAAKVIKLRATDDVGNVGTKNITLNVKQSTDTPAIAPSNFDETLTSESAIAPAAGDEHNLYGITSDNFLSATLTDDDGVGEVIVSWQKATAWDAATTPATKQYNGNGSKSYTLKHTLPAVTGKYVVKISVTDSKAETAKNSYEIGPFLVAVDGGAPVVSVSTPSGQYKKASTAYTIEGTVSDDTAVTVAAYSNSACTTKLGDATVTNGLFSYELTTDAAVGKTVYFKATDIYKRSSVAQFSYLIDKDAPEFDSVYTVSPTVTVGSTEYVNGKVSLEIGLSDNISLKPKVEYSLNGTTWVNLGKTTKATIPVIDTTAFTDNAAKVIKLRATDDVGNVGTKDITINVKQSTDTPAIAPTNFDKTLTLESAIAPDAGVEHNLFGKTSDNVLSATLTDDDGVGTVVVSWQKAVTWDAATTPETKSYTVGGAKSYTLKHTLPADAGKYVVKISVTDSKAETAKNSCEIGPFLVAVDGGAPVVSVSTPSGQYKKASTAYTIEGTVSDDTAVTVAAYSNSACTTKLGDATVTWDAYYSVYNFSYSLTTDAAAGKTVYFKATDIYKRSSVAQFSYLLDLTEPVFENTFTLKPYVTIGTTDYVNGKISVKTAVSDDITLKPALEYTFDDPASASATWVSLTASTTVEIPEVDTTLFTDNAVQNITIKATDAVGNFALKVIPLNVKQSTDTPSINLSNVYTTVKSVDDIKTTQNNIFGTTANNKLLGTIEDDDGIDSYEIIFDGTAYGGSKVTKAAVSCGGKTSANVTYQVPGTEGTYDVILYVKDSKQDLTGYNTYNSAKTIKFATIAVDNGAPQLSINTASGAFQAANDVFVLSGSVDDVKATVKVYSDLACETLIGSATVNATNGNWSYNVTTTSDGKTIYVQAVDIYGQKVSKPFVYKIDAEAPTLEITSLAGVDYPTGNPALVERYASMTSLYTIKGTVQDFGSSGTTADSSNLEDFVYYVAAPVEPEKVTKDTKHYYKISNFTYDNGTPANAADDVTYSWKKAAITTDTSGNSTWVANVDLSDTNFYEDGKSYSVYFAVKDNAANTSYIEDNGSCKALKLWIDSTNPEIQTIGHTSDALHNLTITAKAYDGQSGLPAASKDAVKLILNGSVSSLEPAVATTTEVIGSKTYTVYTFTVPASNLSDGKNTYNVTAYDKANNSVTYGANGEIDNSAPVITLTNPLLNHTRSSEGYYYTNSNVAVENTVTASGNYIGSYEVVQTKNGTAGTSASVTGGSFYKDATFAETTVVAAEKKAYKGTITFNKGSASAKYEQKFTAINAYGAPTTDSIKYIVDLDDPTISDIVYSPAPINNYFDATKPLQISGYAFDGQENASGDEITITEGVTKKILNKAFQSGLSEVQYSLYKGNAVAWNNTWTSSTTGMKVFWESTTGLSTWKIKLNLEEEGNYTVFIRAIDNVGNITYANPIALIADLNEPEFDITKVNSTAISTNALAQYYNDKIVVEGTVTEKYLKSFKLYVDGSVTPATLATAPTALNANETQDWKYTIAKTDGAHSIKVVVEDQFGKKAEKTYTTTIDSTKPVWNKRNGDTEGESTFGGKDVKTLDSAAGHPWFNSQSQTIYGEFFENGSGINKIYYKVAPATADAAGTTYGAETDITANDQGTYESFRTTISGLAVSTYANKVKLWAEDIAGNKSTEITLDVFVDQEKPELGDIKFSSGSITDKTLSGSILSNGSNAIVLKGTYKDDASGVDTIKVITSKTDGVNVDSIELTATKTAVTGKSYDGTWTVTIPTTGANSLATLDDFASYTVYIKVTDNAGNESDNNKFELQMDTSAPTTSISSPTAGSTINGLVTLSGSVEEENTPLSVALYYYKVEGKAAGDAGITVPAALSNWTLLKKLSTATGTDTTTEKYGVAVSDIYGWKIADYNINGLLTAEKSKAAFYLLPVAYDEAGNCSVTSDAIAATDYNSYTIDLDSDRPVIKFSSLSAATGNLIKYSTSVSGTIEDDDGVVKVLKISTTAKTTQTDWDSYTQPDGTLTFSSGSFTYTPASAADGSKTMYFYIEDSAGGKFWTSNASGKLKMPKQSFKTSSGYSTAADNNAVITYITDSSPAEVGTPKYATSSATFAYNTTGITFADMASKNMVGGESSKFVMLGISATDTNGIKSVKFDFEDDNITDQAYIKGDAAGTTTGMTFVSASNMYYTAPIDLSSVASNVITLTITITDGADIESTVQKTITVDNGKPALDMTSPVSSDIVTGKITLTGTTSDEMSAISTVKYLVLNNTYYSGTTVDEDAVKTKLKSAAYTCTNLGAANNTSWKFEISDLPCGKKVGEDKHLDLNDYSKLTHTAQNIYTVPIWFYIVDALGNETFVDKEITYNPYGDRPTAEITDPTGTAESPSNTNGMIRINGGASDNVQVKEVYLQIDTDNDGDFDAADIANLKSYTNAKGEKIYESLLYKASGNNLVDVKTSTKVQLNGEDAVADYSANDNETTDFWGIKVTGTNSWNTIINSSVEFQNNATKEKMAGGGFYTNKYRIRIRAAAFDNNYTLGSWSDVQEILIDVNVPTVAGRTQSIIEADAEGAVVATKDYVSDMYLKGTNSLKVSVEDKAGIEKVEYIIADSEAELATTPAQEATPTMLGEEQTWGIGDAQTKGYEVTIPFGVAATYSGSKVVKIIAYKDSTVTTTAYKIFYVNFDNTAPELSYISLNSKKYADSEKKIVNTNGVFTIGGVVKDEGSGFERFAFYYLRKSADDTNYRIYDPMLPSSNTSSRINLTVGEAEGNTPAKTLDGRELYGSSKKVSVDSTGKKLTLSSAVSANIRAGGIVEIAGSWYLIESKSADGKTITLATSCPLKGKTNQTAFFAYAQIIDNTGTEKPVWSSAINSNATFENASDDGDGMPESIVKSQATYTFDASIRSNFIPDGPGKLVVFAFDKAGNISSAEFEASVENNAPRITKVWLGTDLNGDKDFTANEFTTYDVLAKVGMEQSSYEMNTKDFGGERFRVLDKLAVVTEFVGGNNATGEGIKLAYKNNSTTEKKMTSTAEDLISASAFGDTVAIGTRKGRITAAASSFVDSGYTGQLTRSKNGYIIDNTALKSGFTSAQNYGDSSVSEGVYSERAMSFTFWDDTEDTVQGTNSCYAFLKISDFIVLLNDTIAPNVSIDPFFWTAKDDNSLYQNSFKNGHIDLSSDLVAAYNEGKAAAAKVSYLKPEVSGKVSVRGTAYDEHKLKYIWGKFTDFDDPTGLTYTLPDRETAPAGYTLLARFDGTWHCADNTVEGQALKFTVDDSVGVTQQGHLVNWQLDIDTSGMTSGCKAASQLDILVQDAADTMHSSLTTSTSKELDADGKATTTNVVPGSKVYSAKDYNIPSYAMKVVPYISGIEGATRSKLGRYGVRAGETITIKGFNFPTGNPTITRTNKAGTTLGTIAATDVDRVSATSVTMKAPNNSGYINMSWTAGSTGNNSNINHKYNIEEGDATSLINGKNYWTDDRYISVWNVGDYFDQSFNPISGTVEKFTATGGQKFKEGSNYDNSIAKDSLLGVWASNDKMMHDAILATGKSRQNNICHQANNVFANPPDDTDVLMLDNIPFYSILDNGVNGSGDWKGGIMILQDGQTYQTASNGFALVLEMQGNSNIESPDSSDGKDEKLYQFQNPKIAGYVDGDYYVYTTYYDTYAHCLKYGEVKFTKTGDKKPGSFTIEARTYDSPTTGDYVIAGYDTTITDGKAKAGGGYESLTFQEEAGQWNDIKIYNKKPVVVYYDKTDGCLKTAYGKSSTPTTERMHTAAGYTAGIDGWYRHKLVNPSTEADFGRYVSMEMDNNGGLHIVAQGVDNSILYYGYVTAAQFTASAAGNITVDWQIVDATSSVGRWTDIKLETPAGAKVNPTDASNTFNVDTCKPIITYMDTAYLNTTKAVKVAYRVAEGWEAMTDPAIYEAADEKLSIVSAPVDKTGAAKKLAIGINANLLGVDFLCDEE